MSDPIDEIRRICNDAGDDLLSRISTVLGFDNIVAELQAENERQRNEIKSLTERDTRLVKARDDARDEVDALKSCEGVLRDLATALDGAFISTWQSTAAWSKQLETALDWIKAKDETNG